MAKEKISSLYLPDFSEEPFTLGELPYLYEEVDDKKRAKSFDARHIRRITEIHNIFIDGNYKETICYGRVKNRKTVLLKLNVHSESATTPGMARFYTFIGENIDKTDIIEIDCVDYKHKDGQQYSFQIKHPIKFCKVEGIDLNTYLETLKSKRKNKKQFPVTPRGNVSYNESRQRRNNSTITIDDKLLAKSTIEIEIRKYKDFFKDRYEWQQHIFRPVSYLNGFDTDYVKRIKSHSNYIIDYNTFNFFINQETLKSILNNGYESNEFEKEVYYAALALWYINKSHDVKNENKEIEVPDEREIWFYCLLIMKNFLFNDKIEYIKERNLRSVWDRINKKILDRFSIEEQLKDAVARAWNCENSCNRFPKETTLDEKKKFKKEAIRLSTVPERKLIELIRKIVYRRHNYGKETQKELMEVFGIKSNKTIIKVMKIINDNKINHKNYKKKIIKLFPNLYDINDLLNINDNTN